MKSDFTLAFNEIIETRALPKEVVIEAIEQALVSAYRRDANMSTNQQKVMARIDATGAPQILVEKEVVDHITDGKTEVLLGEAQQEEPEAQLGDMVMVPVETSSRKFGRIAAQTAKQVILQRIREAERETLYDEFIEREGDLMTGTVQSTSGSGVTLNLLGRAEAIMPRSQMMPGERFKAHEKVRVFVVEVNKSTRGPQIVVSRTHKDMLRRLLEYEVPEVYNGQVEIKNIAREPSHRSKVAVVATQEGIDPVGACVGMRGMRIQNIISELNGEKIDVIEWDADPRKFIAKSLSPARVTGVYLNDEVDQMRTATVVVPEDHLSLAIGREGQNARLAAKLTGWRIDIKSVTETAIEDFGSLDDPSLLSIKRDYDELVAEVERILGKKAANRPIMPEEYNLLIEFVTIVEETKVSYREQARDELVAMLDAVRPLVPEKAFEMNIESLELASDITRALGKIDNVGDLMVRLLSDEAYLEQMLIENNAGEDALEAIKYALDDLVMPELMQLEEEAAAIEEEVKAELEDLEAPPDAEAEAEAEAELELESEEALESEEESLPELDPDEEAPPAFPEMEMVSSVEEEKPKRPRGRKVVETVEVDEEEDADDFEEWDEDSWEELDDESDTEDGKKTKKKGKSKRRHLVYDEDLGEVVARRRRKGSRKRRDFDFDDFE